MKTKVQISGWVGIASVAAAWLALGIVIGALILR